MSEETAPTAKAMNLRYAGACINCGATIPQGERAMYDKTAKAVYHIGCPDLVLGNAGASADREYEKRHGQAVARIQQQTEAITSQYKDNWVGRIVAKREVAKQVDTRALKRAENWHTGAVGEEKVAVWLDKLEKYGIKTLHDRLRVETKRANIDHIAITPCGVWVIDAKRYQNKRPELRTKGGLLAPYEEHLYVGNYNEDKRVRGVHEQIFDVQLALQEAGFDISVKGMLCFVDADWGLFGNGFVVNDIRVCYPRLMKKYLVKNETPSSDVGEIASVLARHFPQA